MPDPPENDQRLDSDTWTRYEIKFPRVKLPRFSWVCYRNGAQRGPLVYFKRPGIIRVQGRCRGIVVYWLGWL